MRRQADAETLNRVLEGVARQRIGAHPEVLELLLHRVALGRSLFFENAQLIAQRVAFTCERDDLKSAQREEEDSAPEHACRLRRALTESQRSSPSAGSTRGSDAPRRSAPA